LSDGPGLAQSHHSPLNGVLTRNDVGLEVGDPTRQNGGRVTVGTIELDQIALDAVVELFDPGLQLAVSEDLVAVVDRLELAAVDGDDAVGEELHPAAQQHELLADLADGLAVVTAEVGNGLEVRGQAPGQPDQFEVALRLGLQASARLHPVEVAVDIDLEQRRRAVGRPARHRGIGALEAQLPKIEFIDEDIDDANCAVLVDPVIQPPGEEDALRSILTFDVPPHRSLPS
jgi:hypothetical protein